MENIVLGSCFSKISHIKGANVYRYFMVMMGAQTHFLL